MRRSRSAPWPVSRTSGGCSRRPTTAGFGLKDLTWYQYFFTECRAIFVYLREFVLPFGLNADWDFPISKTILDRGAVFGLIALLALAAAAWHYRRRYPSGKFRILCVSGDDGAHFVHFADSRPDCGTPPLLRDFGPDSNCGRVAQPRQNAARYAGRRFGAALLIFAVATHSRAEVWSSAVALWQDTAEKSPEQIARPLPTRQRLL